MKIHLKLLCCVACAVSLALVGCDENKGEDEVLLPIFQASEPNYSTVNAYVGTICEEAHVAGSITTPYNEEVAFVSTGGTLESFNVRADQSIEEGDLIATLRDDDLEYEIAQQELKMQYAKSTLDTLIEQGADEDEIAFAEIDYKLEKAGYDSLCSKRAELSLYAPVSGKITWAGEYKAGKKVSQGEVLCIINDTSRLYITCSNELIGRQSFGTKVKVVQGVVAECDGIVVDTVWAGYRDITESVVDVDDLSIFSDMGGVELVFTTNRRDNAVIVPTNSIKTFSGRTYVNVLINGIKVEMDVETGISTGGETEIVSGLEGNEVIALN